MITYHVDYDDRITWLYDNSKLTKLKAEMVSAVAEIAEIVEWQEAREGNVAVAMPGFGRSLLRKERF